MKGWKQCGKYYLEHETGKFRIDRVKALARWRFTLWAKRDSKWVELGSFSNAAEADEYMRGVK